jgi:hypothetical protein
MRSLIGRDDLKMNRRFVAILGLLALLSTLGLPFVQSLSSLRILAQRVALFIFAVPRL